MLKISILPLDFPKSRTLNPKFCISGQKHRDKKIFGRDEIGRREKLPPL